jgi:hypothetical protein
MSYRLHGIKLTVDSERSTAARVYPRFLQLKQTQDPTRLVDFHSIYAFVQRLVLQLH